MVFDVEYEYKLGNPLRISTDVEASVICFMNKILIILREIMNCCLADRYRQGFEAGASNINFLSLGEIFQYN
jgi:hypothetical protein